MLMTNDVKKICTMECVVCAVLLWPVRREIRGFINEERSYISLEKMLSLVELFDNSIL